MEVVIKALSAIAPTYPFEVPQDARVPYITYQITETPIRTKNGIAGYEGTLSLSVFATSLMAADTIASRVIAMVDGKRMGARATRRKQLKERYLCSAMQYSPPPKHYPNCHVGTTTTLSTFRVVYPTAHPTRQRRYGAEQHAG